MAAVRLREREIETEMRRVKELSVLSRAWGSAAAPGSAANNTFHQRVSQAAKYNTSSYHKSHWFSNRLSSCFIQSNRTVSQCVAGTVFFSAAASSQLQNIQAKEAPPLFKPKDVVLYQYEACPFCNKIKGIICFRGLSSLLLVSYFSFLLSFVSVSLFVYTFMENGSSDLVLKCYYES